MGVRPNSPPQITSPYEYMGASPHYEPDFLVRLVSDLNLLLEIKGYEVHNPEQTNSTHNAARRWVTAVNNLGAFGKWNFLVCRDLDRLLPSIAALLVTEGSIVNLPSGATTSAEAGTLFG